MKKILYTFLGLGALLATSCSMDLEPVGSIPDDKAFETINDAEYFRNGFYNRVRALSTGGYISYTEIQMDQFLGTSINGNRIGTLNNGNVMSNDADIESIWAGLYSGIADCNYFLENAPALVEQGKIIEEIDQLNLYVAEARFIRAYFYYWLLDHYCPAYKDATKDQKLGLPIVTVYYPTADRNYYPERSTLAETYTFIETELAEALKGLEAWESIEDDPESDINHKSACVPMSPYLCSWTVKAMQARLALIKGDYATAKSKAQEVIDCGIYRLANSSNYTNMWTNDTNNELIFRPISTAQELGISSTGKAWIGSSKYQADYIPVPTVATQGQPNSLYDKYDCRYSQFIGKRNLLVEGALVLAPIFNKYPGNTSLQTTSTPNIMNMAKPFRLSEMYLIVAEAAAETGDETTANNMLETLRKNRYTRNVAYTATSGDALIQQVRLERNRELIGEGFRMSDLRRWGLGFNRADDVYPNFPMAGSITNLSSRNVVYQPNDYRYVWPLPATELQTNPQISDQQNPGY